MKLNVSSIEAQIVFRYNLYYIAGRSNGMFYTYVLKSLKDGSLYTGWTVDLELRLEKHNKGLVEATKKEYL